MFAYHFISIVQVRNQNKMDSGNNIFITQTKTREGDNEPSTDGVLSDILDMEMIFDVKNVVFSDISEDEMVVVGEALKAREINRFARRLQEIDHNELVKGGLSKKWRVNQNGQFRCLNSGKMVENHLKTKT